MKLLGGAARGMNLVTVKGMETRPALARVRNSLFNILAPRLPGARVLDLFAGTGSLGLECLSRGAASAVFVDGDRRCAASIRASLDKMRMTDRGEVRCADAFRWSPRSPVQGPQSPDHRHPAPETRDGGPRTADFGPGTGDLFDLVFIDPPYAFYTGPRWAERLVGLVEGILKDDLAPDGRVILEHRKRKGLVREPAGGTPVDRREYGQTVLSFYAKGV